MVVKIGLEGGHGLRTAGKQTPDGIKEWTLNDKVCDNITRILSDYDCEIIRTDHNEGNVDEGLYNRRNEYIIKDVDAFVSIHHNAFNGKWNNATGVEVFTDRNYTSKDMALAKAIYENFPKYTGLKGRGIKQENWAVINQNKIPAVLVEGGFMDSKIDHPVITSSNGQLGYAKAVAEGLIKFLNLKKKTINTPSKPSTPPSANTNLPKTPFSVQVLVSDLNYRSLPSMSGKILGQTGKGSFTIVEVKNGWGKLKSGAGWIYLENSKYCKIGSVVTAVPPKPQKSLDAWAKEVINGKHGAGHANRESSLKKAGCTYPYSQVRDRVNKLCKK